MSYPETARAFTAAEHGPAISGQHDALPMSAWAEARRDLMSPQTIAMNHAAYVRDAAQEARENLAHLEARPNEWFTPGEAIRATRALRALLAAIGEGEA